MDYSKFMQLAIAQDSRNLFSSTDSDPSIVPNALKAFYKTCNPVEVDIDFDGVYVHFIPAEELKDIQQEYAYIHAQFIFATCNGDPIFYDHGVIYTCPHGVANPDWEQIADSFDQYLDMLFQEY